MAAERAGGAGKAVWKVLRYAGIALGLAYAGWNLHHEYTLKYLYAGGLNMAMWRGLNADALGVGDASRMTNAELAIPKDPPRCAQLLPETVLPASCDFLGGNLGGKSRNCDYWWLGRKCYVVYMPVEIHGRDELRKPLLAALSDPCAVMFDPASRPEAATSGASDYEIKARRAFGCDGSWLPLKQEVKLYVVDGAGGYTLVDIEMKTPRRRGAQT
ncbi:MAG: hypothetical protein KDJ62_08205 [Rhodobiaceae bacterium]|nr:hypothetical protein [Rhodobiaceae bacterium]MCC0048852.1 hypothetical protein [Rhodobiaceae bacterium]